MTLVSEGREADSIADPLVRGRHTRLEVLHPADVDQAYELFAGPETSYIWWFRGGTPSRSEFAEQLWSTALAMFLVVGRRSGSVVALTGLFAHDAHSRSVHLAIQVAPRFHRTGWPLEGALLAMAYGFTCFDLRRTYLRVPGFASEALASVSRSPEVRVEAELPDYHFYGGRWWPHHIWSVDRPGCLALCARAGLDIPDYSEGGLGGT